MADHRGVRLCSVAGCGRRHHAKGFCNPHYNELAVRPAWTAAQYEVCGATATLYLPRRDASPTAVLVDAADLAEVLAAGPWFIDGQGRVTATRPVRKLHRWLLGCAPGDPGVDHRNGDPLDNRRSNLRAATKSTNGLNRAAAGGRGSSNYIGVQLVRRTGRWRARQQVERQWVHVGMFATEAAAAAAIVAFRSERGLPTDRLMEEV